MKVNLDTQLPVIADEAQFEQPIGLSPLGTPVFDDVTFPAGSFFQLDGTQVFYETLSLVSVRYIVNQTKNIVRTSISGRNGTVKEYNSDGDYIIRGQANLSENGPIFPAEQLNAFVAITEVPESIPIISKILNQSFGINNVIISSFNVNPGNGSGNVIVDFVLESDRQFDLNEFIISNV